MAWQGFGTLAAGNQNLSLFDTLTGQIAKTVIVPCTASGTNTITLTGTTNAPAIASYSDLVTFSFLAAATSTGTVTALFTGLATLNVYLADGSTAAAAGNLVSGQLYTLTYSAALNAGGGGFYLGRITVPVGITSGMQLIQKQTASASSTIDFTNGIGANYGTYLLELQDCNFSANTDVLVRVSLDGGATWKAGATDYGWTFTSQVTNGNPTGTGSTGDTSIKIASTIASGSTLALGGTVKFWTPNGTSRDKMFLSDLCSEFTTAGSVRRWMGAGSYYGTTSAINGVRILPASGNITTGIFSLYGMPNA